ncbi:hypothetical protein GCM10022267_07140 [Lentzea roselyniae]|uniref:Lipoprotein n=1 Tax=Lentzea roselyniae TaxID=531940 RepID=A0ABP7A2D9_9PSEU
MRRVVLLVLLLVAVASCGMNQSGGGPATIAPGTTPDLDVPALTKAADVVQPLLESGFASTYAGLEVRSGVPMLVVYRKPDPRLDAEVREAAPDVRIEFRDARYARVAMAEHVRRVMDDTEHWKGRGAQIVSAGPEVDGSGVRIGVTEASADLRQWLEEYYPAMSFKVETSGKIVPAPATEPPVVFPTT